MRLLSLDYDPVYGGDETVRASFLSDVSAFDFDVVIWDPAQTFKTYIHLYPSSYMGLPSLSDDMSVLLSRDVRRRNTEFADFVESGRTLIVIVRPPQECYIATGEKQYSGTGRSRVATRIVNKFDLLTAVPLDDLAFLRGSGTRIEYVGSGPIVELLRKYKDRVEYSATVSQAAATPLARVTGTDRMAGVLFRSEKAGGHVILLPTVNLLADDGEIVDDEVDDPEIETSEWSEIAPQFQSDLLEAVKKLGGIAETSRPAWMEGFATDEQLDMRSRLVEQRERVENARQELAALEVQREEIDAKDQLFLGTGRALELEVKAVFELLGGVVSEPEAGRDDWRVDFPEGRLVVEVKGVGKSAAEKHAAQLEKWVAGALEETGSLPKGVLIANTWREVPLSQRTEADFPAQMLPYSKSRGHCLISGLQLFVIRMQVESGDVEAATVRASIMSTEGTLDGFTDWRTVLHEVEVKEIAD